MSNFLGGKLNADYVLPLEGWVDELAGRLGFFS